MQRPGGTRPAKIYPTVNLTDGLVGRPFHRDGLLYEAKVDGWRILAYKDAAEVKLLPGRRQLHIRLTNGASISLPHAVIPELRGATRAQLSDIEILPGGDGLHWPALDFTVSVPGLAASLFGSAVWMSELGRRGGKRVSAAKAAAARRNGLRGGRPRSE